MLKVVRFAFTSQLRIIFLAYVDIKGMVTVVSPFDEKEQLIHINISDILSFGTGAAYVPPMGFTHKPKIAFRNTIYLTANTCTNTIYLPREEMDSMQFNYNAAFSIANSAVLVKCNHGFVNVTGQVFGRLN